MEATNEALLDMQSKAESLLLSLSKIAKQTDSLQVAVKTIDSVRTDLSNLISTTNELITGSHEIIKNLQEIGSAKILAELKSITEATNSLKTSQDRLQKEIQNSLNQFKTEQTKMLKESSSAQAILLNGIKLRILLGTGLVLVAQIISMVIR